MPLKKKRSALLSDSGVPGALQELWTAGFFAEERSAGDVKQALGRLGCNPTANTLRMALRRAKHLTARGAKGNRLYIQKNAFSKITLSKEIFPDQLIRVLNDDFKQELDDLRLNYGRSGSCTAFLLRKILEKLIFKTFAKHQIADRLRDKNGDFLGLNAMLGMAVGNSVGGVPFLMPKTAKEIGGIKFLGDASAHNPLVNVDIKTIEPVMPYIVTAYSELSLKL